MCPHPNRNANGAEAPDDLETQAHVAVVEGGPPEAATSAKVATEPKPAKPLSKREAKRIARERTKWEWQQRRKEHQGQEPHTQVYRPSEITWDPHRIGAREINRAHVESIAEAYRNGVTIPSITVEDTNEWARNPVTDQEETCPSAKGIKGEHRYLGWKLAFGDRPMLCIVSRDGPDTDAPADDPDVLRRKLSTLGDNLQRFELTPDERAQQTLEYQAAIIKLAEVDPQKPEPEPEFRPTLDENAPKPKRGRKTKAGSVRAVAKATGRPRASVHADLQKARGETPSPRTPKAAPAASEAQATPQEPPQRQEPPTTHQETPQQEPAVVAQEHQEVPPVTTDAIEYRQALRTFQAWRADHGHLKGVQNCLHHLDAVEEGLDCDIEAAEAQQEVRDH